MHRGSLSDNTTTSAGREARAAAAAVVGAHRELLVAVPHPTHAGRGREQLTDLTRL
eukprot:COSAG01_NODE_9321_length_2484_cov_7.972327_4_plen_55_part_01